MSDEEHRSWWSRVAPWVAAVGLVWMLAVPIGGYYLLHSTQKQGQAQVDRLVTAFRCQEKALNGILQDVPLLVRRDTIAHDYATIAKECKVAQTPAG